jgi:hypothetical protein
MNEVGMFGISLKKRVEDAERRVGNFENRLEVQNTRIESMVQSAASASVEANFSPVYVGDASIVQARENLPAKEEAFRKGQDADSSWKMDPELNSGGIGEIIANWETIARRLAITPYGGGARESMHPDDVGSFMEFFGEEIQVVRAVRNAVAHARPVSSNELQSAIDISRELLEIMNSRE